MVRLIEYVADTCPQSNAEVVQLDVSSIVVKVIE
jgi:hypothetical protein